MSIQRAVQALVLFTMTMTFLGAQTMETGEERQEDIPRIFPVDEYDSTWIVGDTNGDGRTDYALKRTEEGLKRFEVIDFNGDGLMDDFYFYRNEVLYREELDTNYDGNIDLWIYMFDGVRIERYERDTNYDGTIDVVREFGGT